MQQDYRWQFLMLQQLIFCNLPSATAPVHPPRVAQSNTAGQRSPEIRERDPFDPKEWIRHHAGHAEVFECV